MNFTVFTRAGLKLKEIGVIAGVSHNTAGLWMRGKRQAHHLIQNDVLSLIDAVEKAVDAGDLPLPATTPRGERMEKIQNIISQYK